MAFNDWDQLLYGLRRGECILFLGPEISADVDGNAPRPPNHLLAERLLAKLGAKGHDTASADPRDLARVSQLFLAREGELALEMEVASWHDGLRGRTSSLHRGLAALPFHSVVTSAYDPLFEKALRDSGKEPYVERYHYRGDNKDLLPEPSEKKPVLFHLYGHVEEAFSLVVTETQLLDFLAALIGKNPRLPNNLSSALRQGRLFLFLGFGFRHWYLRILLHVLKCIKQGSRAFAVEGLPMNGDRVTSDTVLFYRENFGLDIHQKPLEEFVAELSRRFIPSPAAEPNDETPVPEPRRQTVFLCHANEDKETARKIHEALVNGGLNPWLDVKNLRGGDRWDELIESTITDEVDYFVVVMSKALAEKSQRKAYVNKEVKVALDTEKQFLERRFILPVRIDDTPLLKSLAPYQAIDLRAANGLLELVRTIKREDR